MSTGKTDVIFQGFKLYIEGVQIPFNSIVINQGIGTLPSANITVPPMAGLMDIARFYQPKVHIFFEDRNRVYKEGDRAKNKVIFIGHIVNVSYSKSVSGSGNVSIIFQCVHKSALLQDLTLSYSGWLGEITDGRGNEVLKSNSFNSPAAILEALGGVKIGTDSEVISLDNPNGTPTALGNVMRQYIDRLQGMPGVMVNFWNQLKKAAFGVNKSKHDSFVKLYYPLMEIGLKFFERMGGHPSLEQYVEEGRVQPCPTEPGKYKEVLIPPCNKLFLKSAVQADMTVRLLSSYLQTSGETTSVFSAFDSFYESIDYEIITLASPAESPLRDIAKYMENSNSSVDAIISDRSISENTAALETIVKPRIPFYYSPMCNVLLPGMYHSVSVSYSESSVPTRVILKNHEMPGNSSLNTYFRAPHSIREALAERRSVNDENTQKDLAATTGPSQGEVGRFEQGRGIKVAYSVLPTWLSLLSSSTFFDKDTSTAELPDAGSTEKAALDLLNEGWKKRYPLDQDAAMNPWTSASNISAHHRILFTSAEYYYSQMFASSKTGSVECPFNPYIVPGYPMDILEKSPILPSFHAMCTSVSHNITAEGVGTYVSFAAANTYSELANYYIPMIHPFLQYSLGLAANPTLVGNSDEAIGKAHDFYYYTLGTTAAPPEKLYNFTNGMVKPIKIENNRLVEGSAASIKTTNGGEANLNLTYEGNLEMTYRPIEDQVKLEDRFGIKFIDMDMENYSPSVIKYKDSELSDAAKYEIGENQFLDYKTKFGDPVY